LVVTYATTPTAAAGYRLRFRGYTTASTRMGGDFGCLNTAATAAAVRQVHNTSAFPPFLSDCICFSPLTAFLLCGTANRSC
jgi:hypothetical protein